MDAPTPQGGMPYGHLEELLKENLEVAKANNKILRRMERNAIIGFVLKVLLWLILLGVPIFFFATYFGPLMSALTGGLVGTSTPQSSLFGIPSAEQLNMIMELYQGK